MLWTFNYRQILSKIRKSMIFKNGLLEEKKIMFTFVFEKGKTYFPCAKASGNFNSLLQLIKVEYLSIYIFILKYKLYTLTFNFLQFFNGRITFKIVHVIFSFELQHLINIPMQREYFRNIFLSILLLENRIF